MIFHPHFTLEPSLCKLKAATSSIFSKEIFYVFLLPTFYCETKKSEITPFPKSIQLVCDNLRSSFRFT